MSNFFLGLTTGLALGFIMGLLSGIAVTESKYQTDAIAAECAGYNTQNGKFEWFRSLDREKNK